MILEELFKNLSSDDKKKKTIMDIIKFGRDLDKYRKQSDEDEISSRDFMKELINNGMSIDLALQIQNAIDNPDAEITFI